MTNITTKLFFVGEIDLPMSLDTEANLNLFIGKYEPQYLERALGYSLAKEFLAAIAEEAPVVPSKWYYLLNGGEYTDCRLRLQKWKGFVDRTEGSPIANYIYYWWTRDNVTYTSPSGEVKGKSENSTTASMFPKQMRAYNAMVDMTRSLHDFLIYFEIDGEAAFPEFEVEDTDCKLFQKITFL